jgi:transcription elongation GreA/GreB family factor
MASAIGQGLMGARLNEEVAVALPAGERRYQVKGLLTLPEQLETAGGKG